MKNVLLGIFLLLSCQVMAQSLMDQYPILSKSTKFTKESPRYKGIPYDSAYLELKAGQRAWVSTCFGVPPKTMTSRNAGGLPPVEGSLWSSQDIASIDFDGKINEETYP